MKKLLILAVLMMLLASPAKAQVFCPFCVPAGSGPVGFASFSLASTLGAAVGVGFVAIAFPYLNTTGEKPFEEMFPSVEYSYPGKQSFDAAKVNFISGVPYHVSSRFGTDSIRSDGL